MSLRYSLLIAAIALAVTPISGAQMGNIDVTGDLMLLMFHSDNDLSFDDDYMDEATFFRSEGHLYFTVDDLGGDNVMVKISLEFDREMQSGKLPSITGYEDGYYYYEGSGYPVFSSSRWSYGDLTSRQNTGDLEVFLEEAYLKIAQMYNSPVSVTLGRQFMNFGDDPNSEKEFNTWWGNSLNLGDSSWYSQPALSSHGTWEIDPFDAARVDLDFDQFVISGGYMQIVETKYMNDDVASFFVYGSYTGLESHQFDLYYIGTDYDGTTQAGGNPGDVSWMQNLVGVRAAGDIIDSLAYKAEFAYNWIDIDQYSHDPKGFAFELGLNWHPEHDLNPNVGIHWLWLEGDDLDTSRPDFFVRPYPGDTFGEIYDGYNVTNEHIIWVDGGIDLREDIRLSGALYYFMVDDRRATSLGTPLSGSNRDRDIGFEIDGYLDYDYNEEITMQLGGGVFFPGDNIESGWGDDDEAYFVRSMVKVAF